MSDSLLDFDDDINESEIANNSDVGGQIIGAESYQASCIAGMAHEDYLEIDAASSSALKTIYTHSPAHYRCEKAQGFKPTKAMQMGTAIHCGILEPELFDDLVAVQPEVNKRTNAGKAEFAAFEAENEGKIILTEIEMLHVVRAIESVGKHAGAQALLTSGGRPELSLFWQDNRTRVHCKARFDFLRDDMMAVDLKTTDDASPRAFARTIVNFEYPMQAAHYWSGAEHVFNESLRAWAWIAIERQPPYGVAVYTCPANVIAAAMYKVSTALDQYEQAKSSGWWESYTEEIHHAPIPNFYTRVRD